MNIQPIQINEDNSNNPSKSTDEVEKVHHDQSINQSSNENIIHDDDSQQPSNTETISDNHFIYDEENDDVGDKLDQSLAESNSMKQSGNENIIEEENNDLEQTPIINYLLDDDVIILENQDQENILPDSIQTDQDTIKRETETIKQETEVEDDPLSIVLLNPPNSIEKEINYSKTPVTKHSIRGLTTSYNP